MSSDRFNKRSYWRRQCGGVLRLLERPFAPRSLTARSPLLWTFIMEGSESWHGWWSYYPEPLALAGYLRHVLVPCLHEPVLVHHGGRPEPESPLMTLEQMLEITGDDDDNIKAFIGEIDKVFGKGDRAVLAGIRQALKHVDFSGGWGGEGFVLHTRILSAGRAILERHRDSCPDREEREEILGCTDSGWIELCRNVTSNRTAKRRFLQALDDNAAC